MALINLPADATLFDVVEKLKEKSTLDESDKELLKTKMDEVPIIYPPEATLSDLIKIASINLQTNGGSSGPVEWVEILNKPSVFPSTWLDVSNKPTTFPSTWDTINGKPSTFPTTWETVTDKPISFPSSWDSTTGKPSVFKPEAHTHDGDTLTPNIVGTIAKQVSEGRFNKIYLNGTELTPGGSSDVTWDSVQNKPLTFTPSSHNHDNDTLIPANIGSMSDPSGSGYFTNLFLNGVELIPGGGGDVTYEAVNGVITDKSIGPYRIEPTGTVTSVIGKTVLKLLNKTDSTEHGMALMKTANNSSELVSDSPTGVLNLGNPTRMINAIYSKQVYVDGVEIGAELKSSKTSLINSLNVIRAVL